MVTVTSKGQVMLSSAGGVVRCRAGTATTSEPGTVPALRSGIRMPHRVRDKV
jgi:hypothetical protein